MIKYNHGKYPQSIFSTLDAITHYPQCLMENEDLQNTLSLGINCSRGGGIIKKGHLLDPDDVFTFEMEPITFFFPNEKQSVMVGDDTTMDGLRGPY